MTDRNAWAIPIIAAFLILFLFLPVHNDWICKIGENENHGTCFREWIAALGQFAIPIAALWLTLSIHRNQIAKEKLEELKSLRDSLNSEEGYVSKILSTINNYTPGNALAALFLGNDQQIADELSAHANTLDERDMIVSDLLIRERIELQRRLLGLSSSMRTVVSAQKRYIQNQSHENFIAFEYYQKEVFDGIRLALNAILAYSRALIIERADVSETLKGMSRPKEPDRLRGGSMQR